MTTRCGVDGIVVVPNWCSIVTGNAVLDDGAVDAPSLPPEDALQLVSTAASTAITIATTTRGDLAK